MHDLSKSHPCVGFVRATRPANSCEAKHYRRPSRISVPYSHDTPDEIEPMSKSNDDATRTWNTILQDALQNLQGKKCVERLVSASPDGYDCGHCGPRRTIRSACLLLSTNSKHQTLWNGSCGIQREPLSPWARRGTWGSPCQELAMARHVRRRYRTSRVASPKTTARPRLALFALQAASRRETTATDPSSLRGVMVMRTGARR